jgi:hypothetical protein
MSKMRRAIRSMSSVPRFRARRHHLASVPGSGSSYAGARISATTRTLGEVTAGGYKKAGLRRMFRSFLVQLSDRIEDKAPPRIQVPGARGSRRTRSDCQSRVVRTDRAPLSAGASGDHSRSGSHAVLYRACPTRGSDPQVSESEESPGGPRWITVSMACAGTLSIGVVLDIKRLVPKRWYSLGRGTICIGTRHRARRARASQAMGAAHGRTYQRPCSIRSTLHIPASADGQFIEAYLELKLFTERG